MDDATLAGQVLMIGVDGLQVPSPTSVALLREVRPGAVVLFGFNLSEDPRVVYGLCEGIRAGASSGAPAPALPPLIAVDHEGGPVYRFKGGLTRLPSARRLGQAGQAAALAAGTAAGTELRAVGITMNLAPVVEALTSTNKAFLSDRAWSDDPKAAAALAGTFIEACQAGGAAAVAKHFPGNADDPHKSRPVLEVSRTDLERVYLAPFAAAADRGTAAVMLSHALVPALDPKRPVTVSPAAVAELKVGLGFGGIVLSDDLVMAAIARPEAVRQEAVRPGTAGSTHVGGVAVAAMLAGVDMLMVSGGGTIREAWDALREALADGSLGRARLEDAAFRIVYQKLRFGLVDETEAEREYRLGTLPSLVAENTRSLADVLGTDR
jgi:beta-N-acetylhexosaminidase